MDSRLRGKDEGVREWFGENGKERVDSRLRGKDEGVREVFEFYGQERMDSRMRGKDEGVRERFKYYIKKGLNIMDKREWNPACAAKTKGFRKKVRFRNDINILILYILSIIKKQKTA